MKKYFAFILLFFIVVQIPLCAYADSDEGIRENDLYAKSCALIDGDSGRVLYGKDAQVPMANASTTKIMTCIVALENANTEEVVTASQKAAQQPKVHLGMQEGEQFYLKDILYALMLESYNDCAVAIAEHVAGSVEAFAALMNEKAEEIGCVDTYFITPNGLDAENENGFHHTTAQDLCRIMKYCAWESPVSETFLAITQTASYAFSSLSGRSFSLTNRNAFLTMMDGVISGKTGFTANAGYCYVAAVESEGRKYCIALLACGWPNNRTYKWSDAKKLFTYGEDNYHYVSLEEFKSLNGIVVKNGKYENAGLFDWGTDPVILPEYDLSGLTTDYLIGDEQTITYEYQIQKDLTAPVSETDIVGTVAIYLEDELLDVVYIYAGENIGEWDFCTLLSAVFTEYFYI